LASFTTVLQLRLEETSLVIEDLAGGAEPVREPVTDSSSIESIAAAIPGCGIVEQTEPDANPPWFRVRFDRAIPGGPMVARDVEFTRGDGRPVACDQSQSTGTCLRVTFDLARAVYPDDPVRCLARKGS